MAESTSEYIQHHLTNLTYGQLPDGSWGFAGSSEEAAAMGFWSLNVDSMLWSIGLGLVFAYLFRKAAKTATAGVPGALQNGVEISSTTPHRAFSITRTISLPRWRSPSSCGCSS